MPQPVHFTPSVEQVAPDEAETLRGLEAQFKTILDTTSKDYDHAVRAVHAKGHGLAYGTLTVADGLPPELAQGLFATSGRYEAIIRLSTNAGDILPDSIMLPRGIALKVLGVAGERLSGSESDTTQDFIMVNGPTFAAPNAKAFLKNLKLLAGTTEKAEGAKQVLSAVLRSAEAALETVGLQSSFLNTLGGAKPVNPLGATYYSQTPFRFGEHIAKFQLVPVSGIKDYESETIDASDNPDAIRDAVDALLIEQGGRWELRAQLCTDLDKMPIEDATVQWDEKESPFRTVATLEVAPQRGWIKGDTNRAEDRLSFSPWHGLAAHQPLGGVNRARNDPYRFSTEYRGRFNGCPIHEPARVAEVMG